MKAKEKKFIQLANQAAVCRICPRMQDQCAILGSSNGPLNAPIMFVAEAPGRFGCARTGIPLSGDRSGNNFETLLAHIKLTRKNIFVTNAVLCSPLKKGRNSRPLATEIRNCLYYLRYTLDFVRPRLVVTLGTVALEAVNQLLGTRYRLADTVAIPLQAPRFKLLPLYHPSPRVTNWKRSLEKQKHDFQKILNCGLFQKGVST